MTTYPTYASVYDPNANYQSIAAGVAQDMGVPTDLFLAQINAESGFNPLAINQNNGGVPAYGIAQFRPNTAAQFGINPMDPVAALYGAAQYDQQLYGQTGNWINALQSYGTLPQDLTTLNAGQTSALNAAQAANQGSYNNTFGNYGLWSTTPNNIFGNKPTGPGGTAQGGWTGILSFLGSSSGWERVGMVVIGVLMLVTALAMMGFHNAVTNLVPVR